MAESARRLDDSEPEHQVYDTSPTAPSNPRPDLKALEGGGETTPPKSGHLQEAGSDAPSRDDISEAEESVSEPHPESPHENQVGSGYRPGKAPKTLHSRLKSASKTKYLIGGGILASIITAIVIMFSFLNVFKLDSLMSNIEQRAFLRTNASINTRSSKWISAYIEARMFQKGANSTDSTIFRSNSVDTNNPFRDWYRTMRTSDFEQKLFEADGIKFVSVHQNGKIYTGKIDVNGEKSIPFDVSASDYDKIAAGDITTINKYLDYLDLEKFDTNKAARQAIKETVFNKTEWWQVFKRRSLRKDIQNMTGVRNWRFFETTRDNITNKKIDIRNRILNDMLPDDSIIAKVARCFYGLSTCRPSTDVADPELNLGGDPITIEDNPDTNTKTQADNEAKLASTLDAAGISDALKKVLLAANIFTKIINIPSTLDMLSSFDQNLSKLVKLVVVARGAQAAGLFQVFETSRDQMKTGQVNSAEVNAFMTNIDTAASSDGWTKVVEEKGNPATTQTTGQCSQKSQATEEANYQKTGNTSNSYAPLCADQRIGSAANATTIQDDYNATLRPIVHPIVAAWEGLKSTPVIGQLIGLVEWFGNLLNNVISAVIKEVLSVLGLQGDVNKAIAWVFAKTSNFLGLTILKGYESAGTMFNWLVQGGAYSAESAARQEGAALTTPATQATAQNNIAQFTTDQRQESTLYDRVASLNNPDSLAFRGMTTLSNIQSSPADAIMSGLHGMLSNLVTSFGNIFGGKLYAATPDGYVADKFAGIQTYDYPQQCYDRNPLTEQALNGSTNALTIFSKYKIPVSQTDMTDLSSWDTETNSSTFYDKIYSIILNDSSIDPNNADTIAEQIYNCNLLDNTVRSGLGYQFGYTKDNMDLVGGTSSTPGGSPGGGSTTGLTSPFPGGWIPNRLDMGFDGTFKNKVVAPFSGTITYASGSFSNWGGYVELKADQKPNGLPTSTLYFAEGLAPAVKSGQHVSAGDTIATPAPSPYGDAYGTTSDGSGQIEWGVASNGSSGSPTNPYADALGGGTCPASTPQSRQMVLNFATWVEQAFGLGKPTTTSDAGCG